MIINLNNILKLLKRNAEFTFLLLLIGITIISTTFYNDKKMLINENYKNLISNTYFQESIKHIISNLAPKYKSIEHKILPGETFSSILKNYSVSDFEINKIINALKKDHNLNKLKVNLNIKFIIDISNNNKVISFLFPASRTEKIQLTKDLKTDIFKRETLITNLNKKIVFKEGKIFQSLYKSATDLSIHPNMIVKFAGLYGFQVDFQRDIKKNDSFQIMYEIFENDKGKIFETGNIVFANLRLSGTNNSLYYFNKKDSEGYFDKNGKSVKKALMKTPINGARLSSSFGMRKHPIDGYNKMHKGTDFAAPMGTPIMASGDGIITKARWCGGGGNCVQIKHNKTYETVYAHMKNFAYGIRVGLRIKQGQIIGYVGSTGKSTGPHLHYEVIANNKKINSQTLKLPSGKILKNQNRKLFEVARIKLDVLKSELIMGLN